MRVEKKTQIDGQVEGLGMTEANAAAGSTMRALLSLPSAIGRGERQFEAEATRPPGDQGPLRFSFFVPASAIGQSANHPLPCLAAGSGAAGLEPDRRDPGPHHHRGGAEVQRDVGDRGGAAGRLEQPPAIAYVARALLGDRLVSNVYKTDDQGRFKLKVPNDPANGVDLNLVTVELAPADPNAVAPRLRADVSAMKLNLGVLRLPPRPKAQVLDVPVAAMGKATTKIPGATLRFTAPLDGAFGAKAAVAREFQTDREGVAHVTLLPGPAGQTLDYGVTVLPPPNSEFAARCFHGYSVASVPSGQAQWCRLIELGNKLEVSGRVTNGDGVGQAGVILTAIRQSVTGPQDCSVDVLGSPATVTTDADGSYRLLLDPGRYRFEYEPPMSSAVAFAAEDDVLVDKSLQHVVKLPAGVLATGIVLSPAGDGVSGCEVRVFDRPTEGKKTPALRARTRTGADGRFSIVLPKSP